MEFRIAAAPGQRLRNAFTILSSWNCGFEVLTCSNATPQEFSGVEVVEVYVDMFDGYVRRLRLTLV